MDHVINNLTSMKLSDIKEIPTDISTSMDSFQKSVSSLGPAHPATLTNSLQYSTNCQSNVSTYQTFSNALLGQPPNPDQFLPPLLIQAPHPRMPLSAQALPNTVIRPPGALAELENRRQRKLGRSSVEPLPLDLIFGAEDELSQLSLRAAASLCRYKSELCRPYEEYGHCKYGDKCQFAHGRHELRSMIRHPKYKTDLCKTYHTTGLCPYGPRCHFIHNDDERQLSDLNRQLIEQQRARLLELQQRHRQQLQLSAQIRELKRRMSAAGLGDTALGNSQNALLNAKTILGSPMTMHKAMSSLAVSDGISGTGIDGHISKMSMNGSCAPRIISPISDGPNSPHCGFSFACPTMPNSGGHGFGLKDGGFSMDDYKFPLLIGTNLPPLDHINNDLLAKLQARDNSMESIEQSKQPFGSSNGQGLEGLRSRAALALIAKKLQNSKLSTADIEALMGSFSLPAQQSSNEPAAATFSQLAAGKQSDILGLDLDSLTAEPARLTENDHVDQSALRDSCVKQVDWAPKSESMGISTWGNTGFHVSCG